MTKITKKGNKRPWKYILICWYNVYIILTIDTTEWLNNSNRVPSPTVFSSELQGPLLEGDFWPPYQQQPSIPIILYSFILFFHSDFMHVFVHLCIYCLSPTLDSQDRDDILFTGISLAPGTVPEQTGLKNYLWNNRKTNNPVQKQAKELNR